MELLELKLLDHEFKKIQSIVYDTTGINLTENKRALIVSRLYKRLKELDLGSFEPYILRLESNADEVALFINRITTNLTKFYREKNQFELLRNSILPMLIEEKKHRGDHVYRIWSAGCSTGEEVYTILFELMEYFNGNVPSHFDLKILGSDIDTDVLGKARSGQYSTEELKGIEDNKLNSYFDRVSDNEYRVKTKFREYAGFKRINLVYDDYKFKNKIDIVFCRNVVIYFDTEIKKKVYRKFHSVMNDPGLLFSGHSENLFKFNDLFSFMEKSVYKKKVV